MLPKRLFISAVLLTLSAISLNLSGCAGKGESRATKYRIASEECIRFGLRRGTYDYNRCIEKRMESGKNQNTPERK